jgi:hypothetical protein
VDPNDKHSIAVRDKLLKESTWLAWRLLVCVRTISAEFCMASEADTNY